MVKERQKREKKNETLEKIRGRERSKQKKKNGKAKSGKWY